jgi:phage gp16-like protein
LKELNTVLQSASRLQKNKPTAGEGDRREELINQIASMLVKMDVSQLNRFKILPDMLFFRRMNF